MRTKVIAGVSAILIAGAGGALTIVLVSAGQGVKRLVAGGPSPLMTSSHLSSDEGCGGPGWVFPGDQTHASIPSGGSPKELWADLHHGVSASGSRLTVDLQAQRGHTVIIDGAKTRVINRSPPIRGTSISIIGQCGGVAPARFIANLDKPGRVPLKPAAGEDVVGESGRVTRPVPFPHVVSETKPEVWYVEATTTTCTCTWQLEVAWTSDGQHGSSLVRSDAKTFRDAATTMSRHVTAF
jgi:hypothetical protein